MTRRELLTAASSAPALLSGTRAAAQTAENPEPEEHEFIQKMSAFERGNRGVVFHCTTSRGKSVDVAVTVCTPQVLRVQMCSDPELRNVKGLLEIKEDWPPCTLNVTEKAEAVSINTGAVRLEVQKDPWKYLIYDKEGEVFLQEHVRDIDAQGTRRSLPIGFTTQGGKFARSNETFYITPGENFYGFGERFTRLNKAGQTIDGWYVNPWGAGTNDVHKHIPFFMSTKGYGVFVNTTFRIKYQMGSQSMMAYTIMIEDPRLDLFIIYGPSLKDVLARYEEITGWPSFPPKKSFGIWGRPDGRNVDDVVAAGKKFRELDIPVDFFPMVVTLPFGRTGTHKEGLARTKELSTELGKVGIKMGIYVYPLLALGSEMEQEARANGYALTREDGSPYEAPLINDATRVVEYSFESVERTSGWRNRFYRSNRGLCLLVDFTNPAAVKWWKEKLGDYMRAGCYAVGMSDYCEDNPANAHYYNKRSGLEMHNLYSTLCQKATSEAVAESSGHRGLINARSGTAGLQRYPICWSGDPNCEWEDMANTVRAGLCLGLSGVPFWSCDTPGYSSRMGHLTPELWIRWSQWTMFLSHMRLMGDSPRTPWTYGDKVLENFRKYAKLRYRLLPYIYSHAYSATKTGVPMMRAMVLEFQEDPNTYNIEDQYMFGDAFLVAPVFSPNNKRTVYLPQGTWYDYNTGKEYTGLNTLRIEPPLDVLPLYVRANSIIPMGPDMSYVGEKPFDPITLDIRVSSEAEFTLYDDDESARSEERVSYRASKKGNQIALEMGASGKTYLAKFNGTGRPGKVSLNGKDLPRVTSQADLERSGQGWYFDPASVVYAKFNAAGNKSTLMLR